MEEKNEVKEKKDKAESSQTKSTDSNNPILTIGIIVGVIILNTIIAFLLVKLTQPKSEELKKALMEADSLKKAAERMTSMGATTADAPIEVVVNIAGTDGERFLKAAVIFEYDDKSFPNLGPELIRRMPKYKDLLINHLSRLTLNDLTQPDAKDKIRADLLRLVNATLPPNLGEVREVLFTSYIIQ